MIWLPVNARECERPDGFSLLRVCVGCPPTGMLARAAAASELAQPQQALLQPGEAGMRAAALRIADALAARGKDRSAALVRCVLARSLPKTVPVSFAAHLRQFP